MASVYIVNINHHKNTPKKYLIQKLGLGHFLFVLVDSPKYLYGKWFFTSYKNASMFIDGIMTTKQFNEAEKTYIRFINGGHLKMINK